MKKHLGKFGVEIEGGFSDVSRVFPFFKPDCSVNVSGFPDGTPYYGDWKSFDKEKQDALIAQYKGKPMSGEIASPAFETFKEAKEWISKYYPDKSNYTCGLHIHVSFKSLLPYAGLMTTGFHENLMRMINKFGDKYSYSDKDTEETYWSRFMGKNSYCMKQFSPITLYSTGDKYRILNYSAFAYVCGNKTFECRAFPAFSKKDVAIKAVDAFLKTINDYLNNLMQPESVEVQNNINILRRYVSGHPLENT